MAYKVAIAISGAVSLGSYEAGTMYELINAIKIHNQTNDDDEHIKIDVVTGASAGGMTAALIAQKLLYDASALDDKETNVGYEAWVKSVDIKGLLDEHDSDNINTSILSNHCVESIANRLLLKRYESSQPPVINQHIACADTISLGLSMSNLNGVDYSRNIFSANEGSLATDNFIETRHQDRFTQVLDKNNDDKILWKNIATAARCCGAFPLAFSPINFRREWTDVDYEPRGAKCFSNIFPPKEFSFVDGGVFNNYPLGMARELAKRIDADPSDASKRYYFYISPNKKVSTMDSEFDASSSDIQMADVIKRILLSGFQQAQFQDWLLTDKYNKKVALLKSRSDELYRYIHSDDEESVAQIATVAKTLCESIYLNSRGDVDEVGEPDIVEQVKRDAEETLDDALARIITLYRGYDDFFVDNNNVSEERPGIYRDAWVYSIALLEKAGDLSKRDIMRVYTITAGEKELAGEKLSAFLGFMDIDFRRYDYLRGRLNARKTIRAILDVRRDGSKKQKHFPLNIESPDIDDIEKELNDLGLHDADMTAVDLDVRNQCYDRLKKRYYRYIKHMGVPRFFHGPLFVAFVKGKICSILALKKSRLKFWE